MDLKVISIIFILSSNNISIENKIIYKSCDDWWKENVLILPRKNPKRMQNKYVVLVNHRPVMGYICNPGKSGK